MGSPSVCFACVTSASIHSQEQSDWIQTLLEAIKWAPDRPITKPSDHHCKECNAEFSMTKWCSSASHGITGNTTLALTISHSHSHILLRPLSHTLAFIIINAHYTHAYACTYIHSPAPSRTIFLAVLCRRYTCEVSGWCVCYKCSVPVGLRVCEYG